VKKSNIAKVVPSENNVEIIVILDRSGSMHGIQSDVIGGYNSFIQEQLKEKGKASVSLVLFDDKYEVVYRDRDIKEVPELTSDTYFARGSTSMFDAIGKAISESTSENAMVLIQTDGYENTSTEWNKDSVKSLIEKKEKQGWDFIFLGADIDTAEVGGSFGMVASKSVSYDKSSFGVEAAFTSMTNSTTSYRNSKL